MPFDFHGANVYFLIDKLERLAYKARRFPAGLPTMPKQRGPHVRQKKIPPRFLLRAVGFFLS